MGLSSQRLEGARRRAEARVGLSALECLVRGREAVYVCVPVSSGKRLIRLAHRLRLRRPSTWRASSLFRLDEVRIRRRFAKQHHRFVVEPNRREAQRLVLRLRKSTSRMVIDPAPFVASQWSQADYRRFWLQVIEKKVGCVVLAPDWAWSHGCAVECAHALLCGIPVTSVEGRLITREKAIDCLRNAASEAAIVGFKLGFVDALVRHLSARCYRARN